MRNLSLIGCFCILSCFSQFSCTLKKSLPSISEEFNTIALIEIPAGTAVKYEADKESGKLKVEKIDGKIRMIDYLPYPVNYGMVPNTLLPKSKGGDGDPLDIIILGPTLEKEKHIACKVIGLLRLLDGGEQDDKLLAVYEDSNFESIDSIDELNDNYPGVTQIMETWFVQYKGPNKMKSLGFQSKEKAIELLTLSKAAFNSLYSGR